MKPGKRPFAEKLKPDSIHEICEDPKGRGKMLLPTPMQVAKEICKIRKGSTSNLRLIREKLANQHGTEIVCPLMTGIFFNIVAGCAEEQIAQGQKPIAPYWRITLESGELNPKTPYGPERQAKMLREEGHKVMKKGEKWMLVSD